MDVFVDGNNKSERKNENVENRQKRCTESNEIDNKKIAVKAATVWNITFFKLVARIIGAITSIFYRQQLCSNCLKYIEIKKIDEMDARIADEADAGISQTSKPSTPTVKITKMVTLKHAEDYKMDHKNRGKAIIFNHQYFDNHLSVRLGTDVDAERLQKVLKKLQFDVQVYNDLDYGDIKNIIKDLTEEDHTDNDCVLIAVLTHGEQLSKISAKDVQYPLTYLWEPFTECLSLTGKPKLFIINACKGNKVDEGVQMVPFSVNTTVTDATVSTNYKIPKHADILLAYSTVEGYYSYRSPIEGTWFIQCLTEVLEEYHKTTDLMKMLTITARKVAVDFTSYNPHVPENHEMTQVPSVSSTLLRNVYFYPKNSDGCY